jgi:hypothetical protein
MDGDVICVGVTDQAEILLHGHSSAACLATVPAIARVSSPWKLNLKFSLITGLASLAKPELVMGASRQAHGGGLGVSFV